MKKDGKNFCLAPWTHLHLWPAGNAYPCCMYSIERPVGDARQQPLKEIWNSQDMRELRLRMLKNQPSPGCERCHTLEKSGNQSLRKEFSEKFSAHQALVETTAPDGSVDKLNIPYLDIRFSNLCNFRCRTCGPELSSGWHAEFKKIYPSDPKTYRLESLGKGPVDLWPQLEEILPQLEEIYFAGGEPFIMEEHFKLMNLLVEKKLFHVRIRYSTNFSKPLGGEAEIFRIWDQFENVTVGASLDAMGKRGEYLRKGQVWESTEKNRVRMLEICPRVKFYIPFTLSLMNSLHLPDFHRDWLEKGLIEQDGMYVSLLQFPTFYRIQVLPWPYKQMVRKRYEEHLKYLKKLGSGALSIHRQLKSAIQFMEHEDRSIELSEFVALTRRLDASRNERFEEVFPEFEPLMSAYT